MLRQSGLIRNGQIRNFLDLKSFYCSLRHRLSRMKTPRPILPRAAFDFCRQLLEATPDGDELLTTEEDLGLHTPLVSQGNLDPPSRPNDKLESTPPVRRSKVKAKRHQRRLDASRPRNRQASERTRMDHVQLSEPIQTHPEFASTKLQATNGAYSAWLGGYDNDAQKKYLSIEAFMTENPEFQLVDWDGKYVALSPRFLS